MQCILIIYNETFYVNEYEIFPNISKEYFCDYCNQRYQHDRFRIFGKLHRFVSIHIVYCTSVHATISKILIVHEAISNYQIVYNYYLNIL